MACWRCAENSWQDPWTCALSGIVCPCGTERESLELYGDRTRPRETAYSSKFNLQNHETPFETPFGGRLRSPMDKQILSGNEADESRFVRHKASPRASPRASPHGHRNEVDSWLTKTESGDFTRVEDTLCYKQQNPLPPPPPPHHHHHQHHHHRHHHHQQLVHCAVAE